MQFDKFCKAFGLTPYDWTSRVRRVWPKWVWHISVEFYAISGAEVSIGRTFDVTFSIL